MALSNKNSFEGKERLFTKLRALPPAVENAVVAAMIANADELVAFMKSVVAEDDGDLRDSIGWTFGEAPKGSIVIAKSKRQKSTGGIRIVVYAGNAKAFYVRWVEFDTKPHELGGMFKGAKHPGTQSQPFFFPSYRLKKRRMKGRVTRAATKSIKQIINRT